jgi:GT2 family glycosyltransferase
MKVFISVVSHGHKEIIENINSLAKLANIFNVVLKLNKTEEGMEEYCYKNNIHLIDKDYGRGFGANNNLVFQYCTDKLNMTDDDYFIIFNPDCDVSKETISDLVESMHVNNYKLATINLYKNHSMDEYDNSLRRYPSFFGFVFSFLGLSSSTIVNKKDINKISEVEWAHGSFLVFLASHFYSLSGFDERYFMYCDDTDICYRSNLIGEPVYYYPNLVGVHFKQAASHKIMSKYFFYHVKSVFIFSFRRFFILKWIN